MSPQRVEIIDQMCHANGKIDCGALRDRLAAADG
jgi:hypothetical protein